MGLVCRLLTGMPDKDATVTLETNKMNGCSQTTTMVVSTASESITMCLGLVSISQITKLAEDEIYYWFAQPTSSAMGMDAMQRSMFLCVRGNRDASFLARHNFLNELQTAGVAIAWLPPATDEEMRRHYGNFFPLPVQPSLECLTLEDSDEEEDVKFSPVLTEATPKINHTTVKIVVGKFSKRVESSSLADLLQRNYLDFFCIDAFLQYLEHAPAREARVPVELFNSQIQHCLTKLCDEVCLKNVNLDTLTGPDSAKILKLSESPHFKRVFLSSARYQIWNVFDGLGSHWYMIVIAGLHSWLNARPIERLSLTPPRVYFFDSMLQDIVPREENVNNQVASKQIHKSMFMGIGRVVNMASRRVRDGLSESKLGKNLARNYVLPMLRVGAFRYHGDISLFQHDLIKFRDVFEVHGQANTVDCGAFLMMWTEAIMNGTLIEEQNQFNKDVYSWKWAQNPPVPASFINDQNATMDLLGYRRRCWATLKQHATEGLSLMEEIERAHLLSNVIKKEEGGYPDEKIDIVGLN